MKSPFVSLVWLAALWLIPYISEAGSVKYGGHSVKLADSFQAGMQCILNTLKSKKKYVPNAVGCYGSRDNPSAHPSGQACDTDQTARDKARVNNFASADSQVSIANGCKAVSGCAWDNRDCGHWERRSAQYTSSAVDKDAAKKSKSKKKKTPEKKTTKKTTKKSTKKASTKKKKMLLLKFKK